MVGLVNIGLIDVFNPENSGQKIRFAQLPTEVVNQTQFDRSESPLPFSVTLGKTEEIQAEAQRIREIWLQGYNYRTKKIKKLEPLLAGILQVNDFINNYWNYFTPDEKIRLIAQASYLKQMSNPDYYVNFKNLIRIIFSKNFLITIILLFKYINNIRKNPRNHIFIQFNNANKMIAELIIELAKRDLEKVQLLVEFKNESKVSSEMTFDEILEPVRQHISEAGISEDELSELFEEARNEVWQEWKEEKKV